jgi:hypothetical protein
MQSSHQSPLYAGNGISDRRDGGENAVYLQAETTYGDSSGFKKPLFRRENARTRARTWDPMIKSLLLML